MPALHQIIVRPVVTEKSSAAYQTRKEYTFEVHPEANKHQIRDALQKLFDVTVTDVRTMQMRRHEVTRGRTRGTTAALEEGRSSRSRTATRSPCSRAEMSIRQFRPMTAGHAVPVGRGFDEITRDDAGEVAARAAEEASGGRNNQGHLTSRHRGGGHKRQYRKIDFKRNKFGIPGKVSGDRVRSQPERAHRADRLRRRREALHPAPQGAAPGRHGGLGPGLGHPDRQRAAAGRDPARHHGAQRRAQDRQGRPDGPHRRLERAGGGQGRRVRDPAAPLDRDAPGARRAAWRRSARSATPSTSCSRSARRARAAGWASGPRCAAWP